MENKEKKLKNDIIAQYMDYVLEHNEDPKSVYAFCKTKKFSEGEFHKHFTTFESIEKSVFEVFFINTVSALKQSDDYKKFDARNKLLSFYFTLLENLTANRSYVLFALTKANSAFLNLKSLSGLKKLFFNYIEKLEIELLDVKQAKLDKIQEKMLKESAWMQMIMILKFWINDTSPSFEKTDIFIEKSVNTSFDVLNVTPFSRKNHL